MHCGQLSSRRGTCESLPWQRDKQLRIHFYKHCCIYTEHCWYLAFSNILLFKDVLLQDVICELSGGKTQTLSLPWTKGRLRAVNEKVLINFKEAIGEFFGVLVPIYTKPILLWTLFMQDDGQVFCQLLLVCCSNVCVPGTTRGYACTRRVGKSKTRIHAQPKRPKICSCRKRLLLMSSNRQQNISCKVWKWHSSWEHQDTPT